MVRDFYLLSLKYTFTFIVYKRYIISLKIKVIHYNILSE